MITLSKSIKKYQARSFLTNLLDTTDRNNFDNQYQNFKYKIRFFGGAMPESIIDSAEYKDDNGSWFTYNGVTSNRSNTADYGRTKGIAYDQSGYLWSLQSRTDQGYNDDYDYFYKTRTTISTGSESNWSIYFPELGTTNGDGIYDILNGDIAICPEYNRYWIFVRIENNVYSTYSSNNSRSSVSLSGSSINNSAYDDKYPMCAVVGERMLMFPDVIDSNTVQCKFFYVTSSTTLTYQYTETYDFDTTYFSSYDVIRGWACDKERIYIGLNNYLLVVNRTTKETSFHTTGWNGSGNGHSYANSLELNKASKELYMGDRDYNGYSRYGIDYSNEGVLNHVNYNETINPLLWEALYDLNTKVDISGDGINATTLRVDDDFRDVNTCLRTDLFNVTWTGHAQWFELEIIRPKQSNIFIAGNITRIQKGGIVEFEDDPNQPSGATTRARIIIPF